MMKAFLDVWKREEEKEQIEDERDYPPNAYISKLLLESKSLGPKWRWDDFVLTKIEAKLRLSFDMVTDWNSTEFMNTRENIILFPENNVLEGDALE